MAWFRGGLLLCLLTVSVGADPFPSEELAVFRRGLGLSVPTWSSALAASAQARSTDLASEGELSHEDRDGRGPGLQMRAEGVPPGEFGEVLAAGRDPSLVWRAWLSSPSHRAVLAESGWTLWGAGWTSTSGTTVWVVRFWKP